MLAAESAFGFISTTAPYAFTLRVSVVAVVSTFLIRAAIPLKPDEKTGLGVNNLMLSVFALVLCVAIISGFEYLYRPTEIKQTAIGARTVVYGPAIMFLSWTLCALCDRFQNADGLR